MAQIVDAAWKIAMYSTGCTLLLYVKSDDQAVRGPGRHCSNNGGGDCAVQVPSPATRGPPTVPVNCSLPVRTDLTTHVKYVLKAPKMNSTKPVTHDEMISPSRAVVLVKYGIKGTSPPIK